MICSDSCMIDVWVVHYNNLVHLSIFSVKRPSFDFHKQVKEETLSSSFGHLDRTTDETDYIYRAN